MTHEELLNAAARPLFALHGFDAWKVNPASAPSGERPDAIGFASRSAGGIKPGDTMIVEAKVSMTDLRADRAKPWRNAARALGTYRVYVVSRDCGIDAKHIDESWGWGVAVFGGGKVWHPDQAKVLIRRKDADAFGALAIAAGLLRERMETKATAREGRLSAKVAGQVVGLLEEHGPLRAIEVARMLGGRTRASTLAAWIAQDAEEGLLDGWASGGPGACLTRRGDCHADRPAAAELPDHQAMRPAGKRADAGVAGEGEAA